MGLLARAAAFTLRPSSSTKLNRALQSSKSVPSFPGPFPSSTAVKRVRMLSSHIAIRKAIRFFWESRPGRSSFGNGGLGWR